MQPMACACKVIAHLTFGNFPWFGKFLWHGKFPPGKFLLGIPAQEIGISQDTLLNGQEIAQNHLQTHTNVEVAYPHWAC